ncbi:hypothetical protein BJ878DRAFT_525010 [Calycina marina]|uniref:Luciferase domain-containing protein n=1 Tax=Calycina marina TaxID=1763456 RepID=A0A9P8CBJ1_9HELO|nr:hypothetical protein BJ878DRAFT_525010 [Calycina marina]
MLADYHAWLKVADTALPKNIFGYILQLCLSPLRSKPFDITSYDKPKEIAKCGDSGKLSFLPATFPERAGPRPTILKYMAPNRQTSQLTDDGMHKLVAEAIHELATNHAKHVKVATSVLEKSGDALILNDNITTAHTIAKKMRREIAHVHAGLGSGEFSIHLALSPQDCKKVIEGQWGERMTLSGTLMPQEYLLVYTPRTNEEVVVVKEIVEAAIKFMTGGLEFIE